MTARITVVGDLLLDRDVVGTVSRICPDAPVPVLDVADEQARPGGAGLAAALLAADGHDVTLVATVAGDARGEQLTRLALEHGLRLVALPTRGTTREKVRVRAGDQSLVRVDRGTSCPPAGGFSDETHAALQDCDAVLVCDYAGGVTTDAGVRTAIESVAGQRPVVWDPHVRGAAPVPGCRLVTPNRVEATALSGVTTPPDLTELAATLRHADVLLTQWQAHAVAVTMGARGALLTYGSGSPLVAPATRVDGGDPCGAGDRFAASVTAALASGEMVSKAVEMGVAAASVFVGAGGAAGLSALSATRVPAAATYRASWPAAGWALVGQVRAEGGTVVATGGCFDLLHAGHVALLRAARDLGDALVVCLNSDDSVRRLKGAERPLVPETDRVRVLEALECVDAVLVFGEDTPHQALRTLRPDVWAKGGDYALADLPEAAVLHEWGGQTVVLPYLDGRSTSALIGAVRGRTSQPEGLR